jgi:hypothetical protein
MVTGVEQAAQLDVPPGEMVERRAAGFVSIYEFQVGGAGLSEQWAVPGLARGPSEQGKGGSDVFSARCAVDGMLEDRDGLGSFPGLVQFVAVHLRGVRQEFRLLFEVTCGGQALDRPPSGRCAQVTWE